MSLSKRVAAAGLIFLLAAPCGGKSERAKAEDWVRSNGGTVGATGTGWFASQAGWKAAWPWSSSNAEVECALNLYGGTTYVQLGGDRYWLEETHGYPPDGGFYKSSAADVETDDLAGLEWAQKSADICGLNLP